ncbi:dsRNA-binding domain-like protein [Thozetella sp. PMI_491]|nr:dsRNA-binding domain-like protein [Thozetella sp. PMI_491]
MVSKRVSFSGVPDSTGSNLDVVPSSPPGRKKMRVLPERATVPSGLTPSQAQYVLPMMLHPMHIQTRAGPSSTRVPYLQYDVIVQLANAIFGVDRWSSTICDRQTQCDAAGSDDKFSADSTCTVEVTVRWRHGSVQTKSGVGSGNGKDRLKHAARESAEKEAETDALKRAFRNFGSVFGLCLYDKEYREWALRFKQRKHPDESDPHVLCGDDVSRWSWGFLRHGTLRFFWSPEVQVPLFFSSSGMLSLILVNFWFWFC